VITKLCKYLDSCHFTNQYSSPAKRNLAKRKKKNMASAIMRSGLLRSALRSGSKVSAPAKRQFSSGAHLDVEFEAKEAAKWEKISYLGAACCAALGTYILSKGHHHYEEPPAYPYLHIRNKEFPWGMFL
ncbi:Cytochrome c oxidase subunit 6a, mitochondrial, partial [Linum perenne]